MLFFIRIFVFSYLLHSPSLIWSHLIRFGHANGPIFLFGFFGIFLFLFSAILSLFNWVIWLPEILHHMNENGFKNTLHIKPNTIRCLASESMACCDCAQFNKCSFDWFPSSGFLMFLIWMLCRGCLSVYNKNNFMWDSFDIGSIKCRACTSFWSHKCHMRVCVSFSLCFLFDSKNLTSQKEENIWD